MCVCVCVCVCVCKGQVWLSTVLYPTECIWFSQRVKSPVTLSTTVGKGGGGIDFSTRSFYLSFSDLSFTGHHLLDISFRTKLKPNLCAALTTRKTLAHNCIFSHSQNTTALQADVFITRIPRLLFTSKGRSASSILNHCQGQLKTPQSLSL